MIGAAIRLGAVGYVCASACCMCIYRIARSSNLCGRAHQPAKQHAHTCPSVIRSVSNGPSYTLPSSNEKRPWPCLVFADHSPMYRAPAEIDRAGNVNRMEPLEREKIHALRTRSIVKRATALTLSADPLANVTLAELVRRALLKQGAERRKSTRHV